MGTIQGYTKLRMDEIMADVIIDASIDVSGHLILEQFGGGTIDSGGLPVPDASATIKGIVELATNAETITGTDAVRAVTPASLAAASTTLVPDASATVKGRVELSTDAELVTGTDTVRAITPANFWAGIAYLVANGYESVRFDVNPAAGGDNAFVITVDGEANGRFYMDGSGFHSWGAGGASAPDTTMYRAAANQLATDDDFLVNAAGKGFRVKEGSNAKMGVSTLVGGTVVVSNTSVTANSRIFLTCQTPGGTPGFLRVSARTASTSFTILSSSGTDTSVVGWLILEPA